MWDIPPQTRYLRWSGCVILWESQEMKVMIFHPDIVSVGGLECGQLNPSIQLRFESAMTVENPNGS